ncbi:hypothetical protein PHMEG_0005285 [Phytophthora megakarya]|uniref:Uncharacterized protein n=1 Tax=Phytophthora megakarya TaxID=4795 RepID=A0A225WRQ8_9STRA|nr:hypothetical protein PHMEG_0005285 [Phytophthora megakarya]
MHAFRDPVICPVIALKHLNIVRSSAKAICSKQRDMSMAKRSPRCGMAGCVGTGLWAEGAPFTTQRDASEVTMRAVTGEEALSLYNVGCAFCTPRFPQGLPKIWDCGVVVGYSWDKSSQTGVVQVTFADGTSELPYGKE